ncbi:T-complex protein 1 subunit beta-like protein, partial [Tanacetum coccineum]
RLQKDVISVSTVADKILQCVTVTNDGATILKSLHIDNPAAEVLI